MKTSGPRGASRMTMTVAAGRMGTSAVMAEHYHGALFANLRDVAGPLDNNRTIASLLRDLAAVQASTQSKWGYKRAASAVLNLDEPIESYLQPGGTLRKIPNIGPSSTRVILE